MVSPDLDEVLAELQARVEERRRSGAYPPGLEDALADHFARIVAHRASPDFAALRSVIARLDERATFGSKSLDFQFQSQVPGGKLLHQTVAKVVSRQTQGILDQVQRYADGMREVLAGVAHSLEDPIHVHADLVEQLDSILEHLATVERRAVVAEATLADLTRRVEQLEGSAAPRR